MLHHHELGTALAADVDTTCRYSGDSGSTRRVLPARSVAVDPRARRCAMVAPFTATVDPGAYRGPCTPRPSRPRRAARRSHMARTASHSPYIQNCDYIGGCNDGFVSSAGLAAIRLRCVRWAYHNALVTICKTHHVLAKRLEAVRIHNGWDPVEAAHQRQMSLVLVLSASAFLTTPAPAQDRNLNPRVQSINSKPHGLSYGSGVGSGF